jgi:hypothetical protein
VPKLIKCHLLTIIYIPCFIYVVFFYKTTFNKSDREGLNSSFNWLLILNQIIINQIVINNSLKYFYFIVNFKL